MSERTSPLESHLNEALDENIAFLIEDCDMHPDEAAVRLGITRATLDQRRKRAQRHTREVAGDSDAERVAPLSEVRRSRPSRPLAPPQGEVGEG